MLGWYYLPIFSASEEAVYNSYGYGRIYGQHSLFIASSLDIANNINYSGGHSTSICPFPWKKMHTKKLACHVQTNTVIHCIYIGFAKNGIQPITESIAKAICKQVMLVHCTWRTIAMAYDVKCPYLYDDRKLYIFLFVHYTISLSSSCKLTWRQWTYKMPVRYILSSVWVR